MKCKYQSFNVSLRSNSLQRNTGEPRVALAFKLRGTPQATINTAKLLQAAGKHVQPMCDCLPATGIYDCTGVAVRRTDIPSDDAKEHLLSPACLSAPLSTAPVVHRAQKQCSAITVSYKFFAYLAAPASGVKTVALLGFCEECVL